MPRTTFFFKTAYNSSIKLRKKKLFCCFQFAFRKWDILQMVTDALMTGCKQNAKWLKENS